MTDAYTHEPDATEGDVGFPVPKSDASFRFMLRSGFVGEVTVAGTSFNRLYGGVQAADERSTFLMFDSHVCRVAINRRHLAAVQFRADGEWGLPSTGLDAEDVVVVVFASSAKPLKVEVQADRMPWSMVEQMSGEEGWPASDVLLGDLIAALERSDRSTDYMKHLPSDAARYREAHLWLRLNDVAFLSVPFRLLPVEKALLEACNENTVPTGT